MQFRLLGMLMAGIGVAMLLSGCANQSGDPSNEDKTFTLYDLTEKYDPSKVQVLSGSGDSNTDTVYVYGEDDDTAGMPEMTIIAVSGVTADSDEEMEIVTGQTNGTYSDFKTYMYSDAPIKGGSYMNQKGETVESTFPAFLGMLVPKPDTAQTNQGMAYLFILYNGENPFSEYDYQLYTDSIKSLAGEDASVPSYEETMEKLTNANSAAADTESAAEETTETSEEDLPAIDTQTDDGYTLSANALANAGRPYYIAGKDFPEGSYKVNSVGNGTLNVCESDMSLITQFQYQGKDTDTLQGVSFAFEKDWKLVVTGDTQITLVPDN